jgi:hypothetical protein
MRLLLTAGFLGSGISTLVTRPVQLIDGLAPLFTARIRDVRLSLSHICNLASPDHVAADRQVAQVSNTTAIIMSVNMSVNAQFPTTSPWPKPDWRIGMAGDAANYKAGQ